MNIKKLFFLFLSLVAFTGPVFAGSGEDVPRPAVPTIDPKLLADVPDDTSTEDARTIPTVSFVAGAYKEIYESKIGDVVQVLKYNDKTDPYRVDNGNVITSVDVQEINDNENNLKTRRIKYSRDNIKIPVQTTTNGRTRTYDSTTYLNVWVE